MDEVDFMPQIGGAGMQSVSDLAGKWLCIDVSDNKALERFLEEREVPYELRKSWSQLVASRQKFVFAVDENFVETRGGHAADPVPLDGSVVDAVEPNGLEVTKQSYFRLGVLMIVTKSKEDEDQVVVSSFTMRGPTLVNKVTNYWTGTSFVLTFMRYTR